VPGAFWTGAGRVTGDELATNVWWVGALRCAAACLTRLPARWTSARRLRWLRRAGLWLATCFVLAASGRFDGGASTDAGSVTAALTLSLFEFEFEFADGPDSMTDTINARATITPTPAVARLGLRRPGAFRSERPRANENGLSMRGRRRAVRPSRA
jgi:hypothetical protein